MLYYQIVLCISMYKHVYWLCAPHNSAPAGNLPSRPPDCIRKNGGHEQTAGTKTRDTKKPAEHPVRGLKPVHHL